MFAALKKVHFLHLMLLLGDNFGLQIEFRLRDYIREVHSNLNIPLEIAFL